LHCGVRQAFCLVPLQVEYAQGSVRRAFESAAGHANNDTLWSMHFDEGPTTVARQRNADAQASKENHKRSCVSAGTLHHCTVSCLDLHASNPSHLVKAPEPGGECRCIPGPDCQRPGLNQPHDGICGVLSENAFRRLKEALIVRSRTKVGD